MALPGMLRDYGEELEADFQRFYQMDLLDVYRGSITPRKAAVLIMHLPPGAAVWQEMGIDHSWSTQDHLLALIADTLQLANWQRGGGKGKQPKPLPRPTDTKKKQMSDKAMLAKAQRFKDKQSKTK